MTNLASNAGSALPPETVNEAHARPRQERSFGTAVAMRRRVQRALDEEKSGRSIQPCGQKVEVRDGNEGSRRHGRRNGSDDKRRCRQGRTHAARRAGAAFELHELVEVVRRGQITHIAIAGCLVPIISHAHSMLVMPSGRVAIGFGRLDRRASQHPVVVRTAVEHGGSREALHGQREQQQPHQRSSKSGEHCRSVKRIERADMCMTLRAAIRPRRTRGQCEASA